MKKTRLNKPSLVQGMTRKQVGEVTGSTKQNKNVVPKLSATLIILDENNKFLMGRRHENHTFMPGLFVFPGGRLERTDADMKCGDGLDKNIENKICKALKTKGTKRRAKGLGLAAIRETCEETGLLLGKKMEEDQWREVPEDWKMFKEYGICPTLSPLRLVARAITPPGIIKRFDTWFFATNTQHIAHDIGLENLPDNELQDIHWISFKETEELKLPEITRVILAELKHAIGCREYSIRGYSVLSYEKK